MKGRNSQVSRIYMILNVLEGAPHGLTVSDLCDRLDQRGFEVGKRTVYRDLDALRAAGFPLDEKGKSEDQGTRWTLDRTAKIGQYLVLSVRELIALYLARRALTPLKDTPFYEDLESTFNKIEEKLGSKSQGFLEELSSEFLFEPGPRWGLGLDPDIVETVRACCTERQVLNANYSSVSSNTTRERKLGPHYLYFAKGSLYLVAEDLQDNKIKIFSLPRINSAQMLEEPYDKEPIDPEIFFESSFGIYHGKNPEKISIGFSREIASYVKERRWHPSQRVVSKGDGTIELSLEVAITPELLQWIMGFGYRAKVKEPQTLIEQIKSEASLIIENYSSKKEVA